MTDSSQLLNDLLLLAPSERAKMVVQLIQSLDDYFDEGVDEALADEIKQRLEEIDNGQVKMVPWSEVRQTIQGKHRADGS